MVLTEERISSVIRESINRLFLNEYHEQLRFNWPEYGYGHSFIDEFIDWIQYSSKKDTLPKPDKTWDDGLEMGYNECAGNLNEPYYGWENYDEFRDFVQSWEARGVVEFDDNGNLYVERSITMQVPNGDIFAPAPDLYQNQIKKYEKNVGGCWAVGHNNSVPYCGEDGETTIILKGYMFLDHIYWKELVRLWSREYPEYEVRTYPNGKVMLTGLQVGDKELGVESFDGPRILRSTFFGNKQTFYGDYAKLGYQMSDYDKAFIDRQGNEYTKDYVLDIIKSNLNKYHTLTDLTNAFGEKTNAFMVDRALSVMNAHNGKWDMRFKIVSIYNKFYNFINEDGIILSPEQWFDYFLPFKDGFACVKLNGKWTYIDETGKQAFPGKWFDECRCFNYGFACVKLNNKWTYIDETGEQPFKEKWFDSCGDFLNGVFAKIELDGKYNIIKSNGELINGDFSSTDNWFDKCNESREGYVVIEINYKYNIIKPNGELINGDFSSTDNWFDYCQPFVRGFASVEVNGKWNYINENGEFLWNKPFSEWFDHCDIFEKDGFAKIEVNGKCNLIDQNGELFRKRPVSEWFDDCGTFSRGLLRVNINGTRYTVYRDGKIRGTDTNIDEL